MYYDGTLVLYIPALRNIHNAISHANTIDFSMFNCFKDTFNKT